MIGAQTDNNEKAGGCQRQNRVNMGHEAHPIQVHKFHQLPRFVKVILFETGSYVAQAGQELTT